MSRDLPLVWDDVKTWDDLVPSKEREIISGLDIEGNSCPHLKRRGESFYYCDGKLRQIEDQKIAEFSERPTPASSQYWAAVDVTEIQLYCLDCKTADKCIFLPVAEENRENENNTN